MASDVSPDTIRGLGLPYPFGPESLWDAEATYTQQGPLVGEAVADDGNNGSLRLESSGEQDANASLDVRVQRGGNPGAGGAAFVWKNSADAADEWRGRDVQQISGYQVLRSTVAAATSGVNDTDVACLPNGMVFAVYQRQTTTAYIVEVSCIDPEDQSQQYTTLFSQTAAPTDGFFPCVTYDPVTNAVYVAHWIEDGGADTVQVRVHRASADDPSTWTTISRYALEEPISTTGSPSYNVGRLKIAFNAGQSLLVGQITNKGTAVTVRDQFYQAVSVDGGCRYTFVDSGVVTLDNAFGWTFSSHSIVVDGGLFKVIWPSVSVAPGTTASSIVLVALPSAASSLQNRATALDTSFDFTEAGSDVILVETSTTPGLLVDGSDGAAWRDDDGTIWFATRCADGSTNPPSGTYLNSTILMRSVNGGEDWQYTGDGDRTGNDIRDAVIFLADSGTYLTEFAGCSAQGRQVFSHISESTPTSSNNAAVLYVGGYTTVTLPARAALPDPYQMSGWRINVLPIEIPGNIAGINVNAGGGSATITADAINYNTTIGNNYSHTITNTLLPGTVAEGIIGRTAWMANNGGATSTKERAVEVVLADGTNEYAISIRIATTGFSVYDDNGALLGSALSAGATVDVLFALNEDGVTVAWRPYGSGPDRSFTALLNGVAVTNNTTTPAASSSITFGHINNATGTVDTDWYEMHAMSDEWAAGRIGGGYTNPDDLVGREFAQRGDATWVDSGARITAVDGGAFEGDTYSINALYEHPISRIFHAESPTPRVSWRSEAVSSGNVPENFIPLQLNPDATSGSLVDSIFGSDMIYLTLANINFRAFNIEYYDQSTTSWVSFGSISNAIDTDAALITSELKNNVIVLPNTGANTGDQEYLYASECAGWRCVLGMTHYLIEDNSPGAFAPIDNARPRFRVRGGDGSSMTGRLRLIPDKCTVVINTAGIDLRAIGIRITAQETYEKDFRIGHLSIGRVHAFGWQYGRGRIVAFEPGTFVEDTPDGTRRTVDYDPGGQTLRIAWTDMIKTGDQFADPIDPDYISGSTTAGNMPLIARSDVPYSMMGVMSSITASKPITFLYAIPRSTSAGTDVITINRKNEFLLGQADGVAQIEPVLGDEFEDEGGECIRVATVPFREIR